MDNATPIVSVVIPTYNAEKYIAETINSVLNQTFAQFELMVIDDCSQDATCSIVSQMASSDCRIKLLKNESNIGVAKTRNRGLDLCQSKYVAFLDADDIWYPEKLERQVELAEKENADIVYSSYDIVDSNGDKAKESYIVPEAISYEGLLKENVIGCSTVLLNSRVLKNYRFNPEFYHEDYVLWLQILSDGGKAVGCSATLTAWRYIENSRSFDKRSSAKKRWIIYRKHCKLPFWKSVSLMFSYATAALKKYR